MPCMYIVRCRDGSLYTGSTALSAEQCVWEHNCDDLAAANYTRKRRPVYLVYTEHFDTVDVAFDREKQVQGWSRAKKEALILGRVEELPGLSRNRQGDVSRETGE